MTRSSIAVSLVVMACACGSTGGSSEGAPMTATEINEQPTVKPNAPLADDTIELRRGVPVQTLAGALAVESFVVESLAPDPADPKDAGGTVIVAHFRLGEAEFERSVLLPEKDDDPGHWEGQVRVQLVRFTGNGPDGAIVRVARATAQPVGETRLIELVRHRHAYIDQPLGVTYEGVDADDVATLDLSHWHEVGNGQLSGSPQGKIVLGAGAAVGWRDWIFELVNAAETSAKLRVTRVALEPVTARSAQ